MAFIYIREKRMIKNLKLAAIVKKGSKPEELFRIPLQRKLHDVLAKDWQGQLDAFMGEAYENRFSVGYHPREKEELSYLPGYKLPDCFAKINSRTARVRLPDISKNETVLDAVKGIVAFARNDGKEVILFQNSNRSRVIKPGLFLLLKGNTYASPENPGLTLDDKLSAVYRHDDGVLLFNNFRTVNTFLPISDYYAEASEQDIRDVLNHEWFAPRNPDALAKGASQWFRSRFAMLPKKLIEIKDRYPENTVDKIKECSVSGDYDINIEISNGKIVFPADKKAAKKLLQFLNEELFRGAITNELYETNSKRKASD